MLLTARAEQRPYHLGRYPLEVLPRDEAVIAAEAARPARPPEPAPAAATSALGKAARRYLALFHPMVDGDLAAVRAPVPDDLARRMIDLKGYGYFMNADQVGICAVPETAWCDGADQPKAGQSHGPVHDHAVVVLVAHGRVPEAGNPAHDWIGPDHAAAAEMRAGEIAVCLARHIRKLGFPARAHITGASTADVDRLAVLAGLAVRDGETLRNPFIEGGFAIAAVTTNYALETDLPLARAALKRRGLRYWWGIDGATSGRERNRRAKRATHLSDYPMEQVKRVDRPTTLILDEEVPRVPKRAAFFDRALRGDLGAKTQGERNRFAFKQPHTGAMMAPMRAMVPVQGGEPDASADTSKHSDPAANARALKSLSYHLGAQVTGICEIPRYAWYSHDGNGEPIEPYHKYAVVMLIDQEFDTMEGASGDDWISGAQSMRAYLRGADIAGVMGDVVRQLGFPARSQTNVDSDVLHIPLVLQAGLGEMSRIGELVLNPFMGPRTKTVVMTTDMPLAVDKPIDFGLQYFCSNCTKCARECPCDAIPWGDKIMFNGYETWKPDVERCARYRLTNSKGSACGRCMKTCPLNKVVDADGPVLERIASWCGINARFLKPVLVPIAVWLDDKIGNGKRKPIKKWWLDLEIVDGVCVEPVNGVNQRDIDPDHVIDPAKQKMAVYHASMMPVPNDLEAQPVDRKAAMAAMALVETPDEARARTAAGGPAPAHYTPTPPREGAKGGTKVDLANYGKAGGAQSAGKGAKETAPSK
ncbi:MAG: reductive dehalogenase domain-containing protein [Alphaproteobacteria bacterium]